MSESINIILKALANSSVSRSTRGIVMLAIKDANVTKYKEYNSYKQVEEEYEDKNLKLIDKAFNKYGVKHLKVVTYQNDVAEALAKINNVKFNYMAAPEVTESTDKENIIAFIKTQRDQQNILVHAVLKDVANANHEGIISFKNNEVFVGEEHFTGDEFCFDIACTIATTSSEESITNKIAVGVTSVDEIVDRKTTTEEGNIFLYYDFDLDAVIYSDAVNTLTKLNKDQAEILKKIRVNEIFDQIRDDIKVSFKKSYRGKYSNSYNDKLLIRDAYNTYFKSLEKTGQLNADMESRCELDLEGIEKYLNDKGISTAELSKEEILRHDTGNKLFLKGRLYVLDTIEELNFVLNY